MRFSEYVGEREGRARDGLLGQKHVAQKVGPLIGGHDTGTNAETGAVRTRHGPCNMLLPPTPHLLTAVETTLATTANNIMTATIQAHLAARDLLPAEHLVDTSYVTADHLVTSHQAQIDLIGPVLPDLIWQGRANDGFGVAHFVIDWAAQQATCPQGHTSVIWKPTTDNGGHPVINIRFAHADCSVCPVRAQCVQSNRSRALLIRTQEQHEALQAARHRLTTDIFKAQYADRTGVEGTISQGTRRCDLRHARYIGLAKTRLQHLIIATALNFARTAAWLAEIPLAQTRRSAFAALAAAPV
jgi:transposase